MPTLSPNARITLHRLPMNIVMVCAVTTVLTEFTLPPPQNQPLQTGLIAVALVAVTARNIMDFGESQRSLRAAGGKVTGPPEWLVHATAALAAQSAMFLCGLAFFLLQILFAQWSAAQTVGVMLVTFKVLHLITLHLSRRAFVTPVKETAGEDTDAA